MTENKTNYNLTKSNYLKLLSITCLLSLTGCSSINVEPLKIDKSIIPDNFEKLSINQTNNESTLNISQLHWENYVLNDKLKEIIKISLENNKDIKIAIANINSAAAQYRIADREKLPTINSSIDASRYKSSNNDNLSKDISVSLGFSSFELDFFDRIKNMSNYALENYLATQEAEKITKLSVISQTAKYYFDVALAKSKLDIAHKTKNATEKQLDIMKKRFKHGIATSKDVSDLESVFYLASSDVLGYETQVIKSINALQTIVGKQFDLSLLPNSVDDLQHSIVELQTEIDSSILFKRPDVLAAEHQLKAANANILVARAAFFPRIALTSNFGYASSQLSDLFNNQSKFWSFSPDISIPIFNYSNNVNNLKLSKANADKLLANYEKTLQQAFKEVADELATKQNIDQQIQHFSKYVLANEHSLSQAQKMYDAGVKDYLAVLTGQTSLYNAQKSQLSLYQEKFYNLIDTYKVIGY